MNEEAVKQLTKQGCMVEKDAAESISKEDVELIEQLDVTPMFVSRKMVENLREKMETSVSTGNNGVKTVQKQKMAVKQGEGTSTTETEPEEIQEHEETVSQEKDAEESPNTQTSSEETTEPAPETSEEMSKDLEEEFETKSSYFDKNKTVEIKDTGSRDEKDTKVEIMDEKQITQEEKDVPEFLGYYNDRYDKMKKLLTRRQEMKSATTINRLEGRSEGEEATTIGFVNDKYSTNSGKYIVELEDKTGTFKALVDEREGDRLVPDEVIGVSGSMGGDIIYANSVIRPDLPIPQGTNSTQDKVQAAYISDLHMGSQDTLHKRLDRFGDWLSTEEAKHIGYLVMPGDLVEGVGVYPGQKEELEVEDIYKQYQLFEEWFQKIPEDIQVIVGPGNHEITRLAEPQPRLPKKVFPDIDDYNNFHRVQNPQMVRLHAIRSKGIKNLMYHGYSFDDHVDKIQDLREKAYEEPHHVMIDLLKRRHLAPTYGDNMLSPEMEDQLVIEEQPDVMVSGHFHSHANTTYKGVNVINSSTFQAQTDFQKRMGHEPDPGKVTIVDYKTRKTQVKQF
ncbi:DNA-directed DNA polymerase II small subunit [Candidatus Nanohalobium constans]|uniref:DNA polymerase II small subunit n=1 Tax=Candidatus Nanohalobium constans TaxID=2565781 RepID=A0A5Q0UEX9_9ARCH|nr:DNA-directed DNA polymerase II small subunit [Candidatus Nanohalobium constans]QGA79911.1 DNA polymerase II small subunit [Candidatus Nanohalobium constans]